jgi:hypothetical protein
VINTAYIESGYKPPSAPGLLRWYVARVRR